MHPQPQTANKVSHFSIKGALTPITVFEVLSDNVQSMDKQLKASMERAPLLLKNAPTVIDLSRLPELSRLDIADLIQMLKLRGLSPVGFRSTQPKWSQRAQQCGLVEFPIRKPQVTNVAKEPTEAGISRIQTKMRMPKVISQPVRSGQRIVAADSDLIIMSSVGAGAEVLASGNIHIYGTLRGRALAGIHGNDQCQIFCHQLEAELLAIAGQYKVCDDIESHCWQAQTHIYLTEGRLIIQPL
jgi:septum site-determining protein MinC